LEFHRFLSHKFGVDLDAFTLMVTPLAAKAVDGGDALQARRTCSYRNALVFLN